MKKFELLKRTYPISQFKRLCDGYDYIMRNTSPEQREEWNLPDKLQQKIKINEKYIYQVAKHDGEFMVMSLSFSNYEIIRKKMFEFKDE